MARLRDVSFAAARALASIGLVCLLAFACATLCDGLLRALLNHPLEWVGDLGPPVVAACVAACFPLAVLEKSNIRIDILGSKLGRRMSRLVEYAVETMTLAVLVAMARQLFIYAHNLQEGGDSTVMLEVPLSPFWYVVATMIALAAIAQAIALAAHAAGAGSDRALAPAGGHP